MTGRSGGSNGWKMLILIVPMLLLGGYEVGVRQGWIAGEPEPISRDATMIKNLKTEPMLRAAYESSVDPARTRFMPTPQGSGMGLRVWFTAELAPGGPPSVPLAYSLNRKGQWVPPSEPLEARREWLARVPDAEFWIPVPGPGEYFVNLDSGAGRLSSFPVTVPAS